MDMGFNDFVGGQHGGTIQWQRVPEGHCARLLGYRDAAGNKASITKHKCQQLLTVTIAVSNKGIDAKGWAFGHFWILGPIFGRQSTG